MVYRAKGGISKHGGRPAVDAGTKQKPLNMVSTNTAVLADGEFLRIYIENLIQRFSQLLDKIKGVFIKKKKVKDTLKNGCVKKLGSFGNVSTKFQRNINSNLFLRDSLTRCGIKKNCGLIELCDYDGLGYNVFE